ncbi:MAG TPA: hypothetical protein VHV29_00075 [Terriglobales bacterium]|nr:hypothetical protein [Terriglobales bacterium]
MRCVNRSQLLRHVLLVEIAGYPYINPIKSKRRVADHGEVFTPQWLVEKMLDMVKGETERIDDTGLCKARIGNSDDRNARVCRKRGKLPCNGFDVLMKLALACRPLYGFGLEVSCASFLPCQLTGRQGSQSRFAD